MKFYLTFILFLVLESIGTCFANVKNLTSSTGLSNGNIICIFQDSKSRMWFGTWDGLNRYDSHDIRSWKTELYDNSSIGNNIIFQIEEGLDDNFWIATEQSIERFDEKKNFFHKYPFSNARFAFNSKDLQIIYKQNSPGLYYYKQDADRFERIKAPSLNEIIVKTCYLSDSAIWVQTKNNRLLKIEIKQQNNTLLIEKMVEIEPEGSVFTFAHFKNVGLWYIERNGNLVFRSNSQNDKTIFVNLKEHLDSESQEYQDDTHISISKDNKKIFVNSSAGGILQFDIDQNQILRKKHHFPEHKISSLYFGTQDILWCGTDGQGVYMQYPDNKIFSNFRNDQFGNNTQKVIRCFHTDRNNNLWIGTKGNGIFRLHDFGNTKKFTDFSNLTHFNTRNGLLNDLVYVFHENQEGDILIGSDGKGINIFDQNNNCIHTIGANDPAIMDDEFKYVYSIYQDFNGVYWIGTNRSGLIRLTLEKIGRTYRVTSYKRFTQKNLLTDNNIISIVAENDSILWLGTKYGLNKINTRNYTSVYFTSDPDNPKTISNNNIQCIYKDKKDQIWIGTLLGLNKLVKVNDQYSFIHLSKKDGLKDNTIRGITEDDNGNLWVTTNRGLSKIDISDNSILTYDHKSGLLDGEFADNSIYYDSQDKSIYLGGNNGFVNFEGRSTDEYSYESPLLFSGLRIYNEPVRFFDYITKDSVLNLKYDVNFFSVSFNSCDYILGDRMEYNFMLENFDNKWIENGISNVANFTNLQSGNYILHVKCKVPYSDKASESIRLKIHVTKPWWKHPIAWLCYFLSLVLLIFIIVRFYTIRIHEKNKLIIERIRRKQDVEVYESKLSFFTNIAHELTTPLSLINGYCERILGNSHLDTKSTIQIRKIKSNALRLNALIKQIMEFRKAETGHLKIRIERIEIKQTLENILSDFREIIEENSIRIKINMDPVVDKWNSDKDCLEKILYNLISNAIKYTLQQGEITISICINNENLVFSITNTCKGIKEEELSYIFDRFKILNNYEKEMSQGLSHRNGIGLSICNSLVKLLQGKISVKSNYGQNVTFSFSIPNLEIADSTEIDKPRQFSNQDYFEMVIKNNLDDTVDKDIQPVQMVENIKLPTILVVDDNSEILDLIFDSFKTKYNIVFANNGLNALDVVKNQVVDIIVSDIMMPIMDGYELTKQIKKNTVLNHIPIILLSSKIDVEDQIDGFHSGADAYVSKPFNLKHLEAVIIRLLETRNSLRNYYNSPVTQVEFMNGKTINKKDREFIQEINNHINENINNEDLNPDNLASYMHISRVQLYRKLKALVEQSPSEYIRNLRLNYAAKLLLTTDDTIQEIIGMSGFNNKASFYKEFTKSYQCSPKEYRDNEKKKQVILGTS